MVVSKLLVASFVMEDVDPMATVSYCGAYFDEVPLTVETSEGIELDGNEVTSDANTPSTVCLGDRHVLGQSSEIWLLILGKPRLLFSVSNFDVLIIYITCGFFEHRLFSVDNGRRGRFIGRGFLGGFHLICQRCVMFT